MSDDDMTAEEFDRRLAEGMTVNLGRTYTKSVPAEPVPMSDRAIRIAKKMQDLRDPESESDGGYFYEDARTVDRVLNEFYVLPTQDELTDWLREIFTADPGGTPFGTAAEELLRLLSGDES